MGFKLNKPYFYNLVIDDIKGVKSAEYAIKEYLKDPEDYFLLKSLATERDGRKFSKIFEKLERKYPSLVISAKKQIASAGKKNKVAPFLRVVK